MIYFSADLHFCHKSIIEMSNRPFDSLEEMHRVLIQNWNAVVRPRDMVYILGDFLYKGTADDANKILRKLRGEKFLVRGNHEKYLVQPDFDSSLYGWVKDYYEFKLNQQKVVLFHYPILEWNGYFQGAIQLYGHVHNNDSEKFAEILGSRAINVGVDMNEFMPVSLEEILERVKAAEADG